MKQPSNASGFLGLEGLPELLESSFSGESKTKFNETLNEVSSKNFYYLY